MNSTKKPDFIKHYSEILGEDNNHYHDSDELLSIKASFGKETGLTRIGVHYEILLPGRRTSWPHAESTEEEFVYVLRGNPDVWVDGKLYNLRDGDGVSFPAGTGISHTFINNTATEVRLLVVGEKRKDNKIYYPLHPERRERVKDRWWNDIPKRELGPHDGLPNKQRNQT